MSYFDAIKVRVKFIRPLVLCQSDLLDLIEYSNIAPIRAHMIVTKYKIWLKIFEPCYFLKG